MFLFLLWYVIKLEIVVLSVCVYGCVGIGGGDLTSHPTAVAKRFKNITFLLKVLSIDLTIW